MREATGKMGQVLQELKEEKEAFKMPVDGFVLEVAFQTDLER